MSLQVFQALKTLERSHQESVVHLATIKKSATRFSWFACTFNFMHYMPVEAVGSPAFALQSSNEHETKNYARTLTFATCRCLSIKVGNGLAACAQKEPTNIDPEKQDRTSFPRGKVKHRFSKARLDVLSQKQDQRMFPKGKLKHRVSKSKNRYRFPNGRSNAVSQRQGQTCFCKSKLNVLPPKAGSNMVSQRQEQLLIRKSQIEHCLPKATSNIVSQRLDQPLYPTSKIKYRLLKARSFIKSEIKCRHIAAVTTIKSGLM